jgi:hypothetical protein
VPETEKALAGLKGVENFQVEYLGGNRGKVSFVYRKSETTPEELVRATEKANELYKVGVGEPHEVPEPPREVDFRLISSGGPYEIEPNLAKKKVTVVFFAKDDVSGMVAGTKLDNLAQKKGFAIRKVALLGDAAAQFEREFGAKKLPHFRIYGRDGAFAAEAAGLEDVERLCPP